MLSRNNFNDRIGILERSWIPSSITASIRSSSLVSRVFSRFSSCSSSKQPRVNRQGYLLSDQEYVFVYYEIARGIVIKDEGYTRRVFANLRGETFVCFSEAFHSKSEPEIPDTKVSSFARQRSNLKFPVGKPERKRPRNSVPFRSECSKNSFASRFVNLFKRDPPYRFKGVPHIPCNSSSRKNEIHQTGPFIKSSAFRISEGSIRETLYRFR